MALTQAERKGLAEAWVAARAKYGVKVVNHIGSASITEVKELARHAQAIGCDAICAMAPTFFKPRHAKDLAAWLKAIADEAPKTPLYLCVHHPLHVHMATSLAGPDHTPFHPPPYHLAAATTSPPLPAWTSAQTGC